MYGGGVIVPVKVHVRIDKLYVSVQVTADNAGVLPPNANAAVFVPAPANEYLAVDKAPPADHDVPLYVSVQATNAGLKPPNTKAAA